MDIFISKLKLSNINTHPVLNYLICVGLLYGYNSSRMHFNVTIHFVVMRKSKTEATSYRPISLTSCVVKLLERIINARLKWFLESKQLLAPQQAGFREHHWTEDQTTYLAQEIEDGFQQSKQTMAI